MEKMNTVQTLFPHLPERLAGLEELAENLWWSWNPGARMLFKTLDRQAWKESGHNPDKMLRGFSRELLKKAAADTDYLRRYDAVLDVFHNYMQQKECRLLEPVSRDHKYVVAYFSAEYGLHRSLPFYAGGLGFWAGDYIKECSDLCLPLVAVGFMYPEGYPRQQIRDDGWQENLVESINREAAPISKVADHLDATAILAPTQSGRTAIHISRVQAQTAHYCIYAQSDNHEAALTFPWNLSPFDFGSSGYG